MIRPSRHDVLARRRRATGSVVPASFGTKQGSAGPRVMVGAVVVGSVGAVVGAVVDGGIVVDDVLVVPPLVTVNEPLMYG